MQYDHQREPGLQPKFNRRMLLLGAGQLTLIGLLAGRLYDLQVRQGKTFRLLADRNRLNVQPIAPLRGRIFDSNGRVLADNREELALSIIPDLAGNVEELLEQLAKYIKIPDKEQARIIKLARKQRRILPIEINTPLNWRQFSQINVRAPDLPGVEAVIRPFRQYHFGSSVGQLIGYVGKVERYEIGGDPALYLPTMRVGKSGAEHGFDRELRGVGGHVKREVDVRGRIIRELERVSSTPGRDIQLTIDVQLQSAVMARVARERMASAVILDATNGDIIAMASPPSYNPNDIVSASSRQDWRKISSAAGNPLMNRTIRGQYPPGSTFKIVTALAGLKAGVIHDGTIFKCTGGYNLAGHHFGCWKRSGHGRVSLHRAIRESCDVYFYQLAKRLGITRLADTARELGFGQTFDCGLDRQKPGLVPDPAWKIGALDQSWFAGETLLAAIGQGYMLATPLQLAVMTARVASGRIIEPRLARAQNDIANQDIPPLKFAPDHLAIVQNAMLAVVHERGGTARRAALPLDGVTMAGKTGTAQVTSISRGRSSSSLAWKLRDHALFVAYAPADKPKYAVAVIVEHGGSGSKVAAPVARDIMTTVLQWPNAKGG